MKTIHKFRLAAGKEPTTLTLREGFRVVRCEYLMPQKAVFLWVQQPLNVEVPLVDRYFRVAMSGEPVPDSFEYLDTALDPFGPEAYHVFEVPEAQMHETPEADETSHLDSGLLEKTGWRAARVVF
ncbi:hypothetical protein SAMN05216429_109155 [Marinobacter persicus]|uniref:DUF7352 domain-containing protein n=1 Tax=Marinobacter persicus TaxID=930118 RepID=A0A1I3WD67_9GAMM|nr:hypothetical protein [Marinobacter persicus]GHD47404.1 hypothetical protein GCM10008110_15320 [Marinobacter persicus]SFK05624.1 hypothetical protein SAMN05216429_109155 [Marinobacter persicus]